ncbi:MAG: MarR family transcriptional regulator [Clostridiales bacterium]|nr:MarR family transcriptional regulator [Clostridiales bacterium]
MTDRRNDSDMGAYREHLKQHGERHAEIHDRMHEALHMRGRTGRRGGLSGYGSFSIIYRQGRVLHDRAMKEFGLSGQQMGYLRYIYENPGVSQEELAKKQFIDKGAVAKSIKDMIEKGYVTREQNPDDKRAYCLFPTEKAEKIGRAGEECTEKIEEMLMEGLTEEEIKTFKTLLKKITDNMAKMLEGGKKE